MFLFAPRSLVRPGWPGMLHVRRGWMNSSVCLCRELERRDRRARGRPKRFRAKRTSWMLRSYWARRASIHDGQTESGLESVPFRRWGLSVTEKSGRWWWRCRGGGGGEEQERILKRNSFPDDVSCDRIDLCIGKRIISSIYIERTRYHNYSRPDTCSGKWMKE